MAISRQPIEFSLEDAKRLLPEKYHGRTHLRRRELAELTGMSVQYYDRLAWAQSGPPFCKRGNVALYPIPEFLSWQHGTKVGANA